MSAKLCRLAAGGLVAAMLVVVLLSPGRPAAATAATEVDLAEYPKIPALRPGDAVRLRGVVIKMERQRTGWQVKLQGCVCYLADASQLLPGDPACIVGTVLRVNGPAPYPVVVDDARAE